MLLLLGLISWCVLLNLIVASSWSFSMLRPKQVLDVAFLDDAVRPTSATAATLSHEISGAVNLRVTQKEQAAVRDDFTSGTASTRSASTVASSALPVTNWAKNKAGKSQCGLYIAESTLPGAGLGSFTGVPKKPMDPLGYGDVCFPNIDITFHNEPPIFDPFASYVWSGTTMGMVRESLSNDVVAYCPGLDCIINCHIALLNTHRSYPSYHYGDLHRSVDPGAGALTPYFNGTTFASRAIPAGGELFKFYGNSYFESRPHMFDGNFPLMGNYEEAEALLRNMTAMKLPVHIQRDLYEDVIVFMKKTFTSRILGALPLTAKDAITAAEQDMSVLHQPGATRSLEWLEMHGRCIDNMAPGPSTIKQAGHGAFATRSLSKDQIVTTSPLHHLPMSTFVVMHHWDEFTDPVTGRGMKKALGLKGYQILVNYCYGHGDSTLLLCPYGNGINYINHNQTRANVQIRWAQDFAIVHNADFVKKGKVGDLMWDHKPQLAFDYIALRDIEPGEELFLDYGDSFEAAWQKHVGRWKPIPGADKYIDGVTLNIRYPNSTLRTLDEQSRNPYADYLQIRAHNILSDREFIKVGDFNWNVVIFGWPARILERTVTKDSHYYTIEIGVPPKRVLEGIDQRSMGMNRNIEADLNWIRREKVPRAAIAFFDKAGQTDMHLPNAFRHIIGIPESIFPRQWKNTRDDASQILVP
jgi:hypothetical protein